MHTQHRQQQKQRQQHRERSGAIAKAAGRCPGATGTEAGVWTVRTQVEQVRVGLALQARPGRAYMPMDACGACSSGQSTPSSPPHRTTATRNGRAARPIAPLRKHARARAQHTPPPRPPVRCQVWLRQEFPQQHAVRHVLEDGLVAGAVLKADRIADLVERRRTTRAKEKKKREGRRAQRSQAAMRGGGWGLGSSACNQSAAGSGTARRSMRQASARWPPHINP